MGRRGMLAVATMTLALAACGASGVGTAADGPYTQADADGAKALLSQIEDQFCHSSVWETVMAGPNVRQGDVANRTALADGLGPAIDTLKKVQASPSDHLLEPDLGWLVSGLEHDQQALASPMTQAEYQPVYSDVASANLAGCWEQPLAVGGRTVALRARVNHIQAWVDQNVKK